MSNRPNDFHLPALFSDHLVLQRGRPNLVWGRDRPGQSVTLEVQGRASVTTSTGADGVWTVQCPELPAGGPYRLRLAGSSERAVDDALVGEVWLASGQSNMELALGSARDAAREIAGADFPAIRLFQVPRATADAPQHSVEGEWRVCTPQTADAFSAVAYFFARELHTRLDVPVGILSASWGDRKSTRLNSSH